MNRAQQTASGSENQLTVLARYGVLPGAAKVKPESVPKLVDPYDSKEELDQRARSYLHANCSVCHVEAGGGNSRMEFEFHRTREKMQLFGARPQHDTFGITNAMLVAPGEPERSVLLYRVGHRGRGQMPPLVTTQVDTRAVNMFREWIAGMAPLNSFVHEWTLNELLSGNADNFGSGPFDRLTAGRGVATGGETVTAGKTVFEKVGCVQCHRFGGSGGVMGPDLTGIGRRLAQRDLLEAILEPSKTIADEFAAFDIEVRGGTTLSGRIEREDPREIVLRTGSAVDELVHIPKGNIISRRKSSVSNMPAGMLNVLQRAEIFDLLTYLASDVSTP